MERTMEYRKGCYIYMENSLSLKCYILLKGQIILKNRQFGNLCVKEGAVFGLASFASDSKYRETAIANTDCEVLEFDSKGIQKYIMENKDIRESIFTHIVEFLKVINRRIELKSVQSDDDLAQKIYDGFMYFYKHNQMDKSQELFERLKVKYENTDYYRKALIILKQYECNNKDDSEGQETIQELDTLLMRI
ncbi:Crp/Fnr family transcriptional regulator [Acetivibrio cellulolyticus]|uniref:Crp/Fnr family transcriptional regulator n=1 Tax=Acetivibrio cellulolyticus TaxID=35830 RepID=UPI0001E2D43A|nr:cyclic nucleotide-binding domain-containing protein [Acetivibrio cellulolyticus]